MRDAYNKATRTDTPLKQHITNVIDPISLQLAFAKPRPIGQRRTPYRRLYLNNYRDRSQISITNFL